MITDTPPGSAPLFCLKQRVYWEDTDAGGVVYYANYLKFLERARTEWLRSLGHDQGELARRDGVVFVVRSVNIDFLRPARLDDEIVASIATLAAGASVVLLRQYIERENERIVCADVKLACVRIATFQPARIPLYLRPIFPNQKTE
jgi:acyl-CoA thioester hydrolase